MRRFCTAHLSALALVLLAGTAARATNIPPDQIQWTYNFSPGAPAVLADGNNSAGVTFTNEPTKAATGSSDVVGTNLRVFSTALATGPDNLVTNGAYSLVLTLSTNDGNGVQTGSLTFTGKLSATFSSENANVSNLFGPNGTQTLQLGTIKFSVQLMAYTPPGPPDQANAGSISAHVTVSDKTDGHVSDSPEPSTLLLSSLGMSFLGGVIWRKRRQGRARA